PRLGYSAWTVGNESHNIELRSSEENDTGTGNSLSSHVTTRVIGNLLTPSPREEFEPLQYLHESVLHAGYLGIFGFTDQYEGYW
ncbi:hypothetical protein NPIL_536961, partial [Nephila pilipes]